MFIKTLPILHKTPFSSDPHPFQRLILRLAPSNAEMLSPCPAPLYSGLLHLWRRGLSGPEGPGGLGSWAARQSSAAGPRSLAASLRSRELAGVERQGTEKTAPAPQSAVGPFRVPTFGSPPHSLTLKDGCDGPALTHSLEAGPASVLLPCYRPGLPDPEPPVRAPWTSAWVPSHHTL